MIVLLNCSWLTSAIAADTSANIGVNSHYIYRGIPQERWSINAGLDFEASGLYFGTWLAQVSPGMEADLYGGYSGQVGEFTYGIGATGYFYTDDFDDTYLEVNLSGGWKAIALDIAVGEYENFDGPTQDYTFLSVTVVHHGFYGVFGTFGQDFDGEYFELGYGGAFSPGNTDMFDYTLSIIHSSDELSGKISSGQPDEDTFLNISFSRGFSF